MPFVDEDRPSCHSERSEESPVFAARRAAEAFTNPYAREFRKSASEQVAALKRGAVSSASTVSDGNSLRRRELIQRLDDLGFYDLVVNIAQTKPPFHAFSLLEPNYHFHQLYLNLRDCLPGNRTLHVQTPVNHEVRIVKRNDISVYTRRQCNKQQEDQTKGKLHTAENIVTP